MSVTLRGEGVRVGVTLCDRGRGKIGQRKRYVIVERPLICKQLHIQRTETISDLVQNFTVITCAVKRKLED